MAILPNIYIDARQRLLFDRHDFTDLHANDSIDEEEHGNEQCNVGQRLG